jgi:hypothetical protein
VSSLILSSAYLPPVHYFSKIIASGEKEILVEQHEHFVKQSYRNRCCIMSANGILPLTVPILHNKKAHTTIRDVKISYDFDWQKIHWKSIESGYRCSPFFEYYEDLLLPCFTKKHVFLFDLNQELLVLLFKMLKLNCTLAYTESFEKIVAGMDFRNALHPRQLVHAIAVENAKPYSQVFGTRFGFIPNLSILDLIFNTGPEAADILQQSYCE